jgi:hypothetical protein
MMKEARAEAAELMRFNPDFSLEAGLFKGANPPENFDFRFAQSRFEVMEIKSYYRVSTKRRVAQPGKLDYVDESIGSRASSASGSRPGAV